MAIGKAWEDGAWIDASWVPGAWAIADPLVPPTQSSIAISIGINSFLLLIGRALLETWRMW